MNTLPINTANTALHSHAPAFWRRIVSAPVLVALCWFCLQKGCAWNPDIPPAHVVMASDLVVIGQEPSTAGLSEEMPVLDPPAVQLFASATTEQRSTNQSLQQAGNLLREAASLVDKNDRGAIRLILQAIAILKHDIMREADGPEHDSISSSPFSSDRDELGGDRISLPSFLHRQISRAPSALRPDERLRNTLSPRFDRPTDDSPTWKWNRTQKSMTTPDTHGNQPYTDVTAHLSCQVCGKPVDIRQKNTLVELLETPVIRQADTTIAWHQDCYDQYLEDGEEC